MSRTLESRLSPWPHRWAWLLACATFPLVWWGGLVTTTGSGMAFRDWLTADGTFLPFYPWLSSAGDKFIEHGHRLLGMLAGLLTIALVISVWLAEPRRGVRIFAWCLLAGVLLQGVLGGMRVLFDERIIALIHGCTGPLFFAAAAGTVVVTSRTWHEQSAPSAGADARLVRLAVLTAVLAYLQLVLGAVVRHAPLMLSDNAAVIFQTAVYFHALMAVAVLVHALWLAARCWGRGVCRKAAAGLGGLVVVQVGLGLATWLVKYGMPAWASGLVGEWQYQNTEAGLARAAIITGHGAAGALIVALAVAIALSIAHRSGVRSAAAGRVVPSTGVAVA